jgi:hypothetical protein
MKRHFLVQMILNMKPLSFLLEVPELLEGLKKEEIVTMIDRQLATADSIEVTDTTAEAYERETKLLKGKFAPSMWTLVVHKKPKK